MLCTKLCSICLFYLFDYLHQKEKVKNLSLWNNNIQHSEKWESI